MTSDQITTEVLIYDVCVEAVPRSYAQFPINDQDDRSSLLQKLYFLNLSPRLISDYVEVSSDRHSPKQLKQHLLQTLVGGKVSLEPEDPETLQELRIHLRERRAQEYRRAHYYLAAAALMYSSGTHTCAPYGRRLNGDHASQQQHFMVYGWSGGTASFAISHVRNIRSLVDNLVTYSVSKESWMRVCLLPWTNPLESRDEWWVKLI